MCILVSLWVEMRQQMIENLNKLKYNFYIFVSIIQRYPFHKGSRMQWLWYKRTEDIIYNKFDYFGDLLWWNETINYRKHDWTNWTSTVFNAFIFMFMHNLCLNSSSMQWL
jgi:hypothetical protein